MINEKWELKETVTLPGLKKKHDRKRLLLINTEVNICSSVTQLTAKHGGAVIMVRERQQMNRRMKASTERFLFFFCTDLKLFTFNLPGR